MSVVLATPFAASAAALASAGNLAGKILIDVTNPIGADFSLAVGFDDHGAEQVAKLAPGTRVFKAMNQVGFEVMADAAFAAGKPVMFVAGDDAAGSWRWTWLPRWALRRSMRASSRSRGCSNPMLCYGYI